MFSRWLWQTYGVLTQREACLNIVSCSFHHQDCHGACMMLMMVLMLMVMVIIPQPFSYMSWSSSFSEVKNKSGWMASNCSFAIYQTNGTSVVCGLTCDPAASFVTRLVQLRVLHLVLQEYYKSIAKSIASCLARVLQRVLQRVLHLVLQLHRVLHSLQFLAAGVESLLTAIEVSLNGDCRFVHVGICLNDTSCLFQTEWRNWIWFAVLRKTNGQWACSERI